MVAKSGITPWVSPFRKQDGEITSTIDRIEIESALLLLGYEPDGFPFEANFYKLPFLNT
jgi:hypothetical protein